MTDRFTAALLTVIMTISVSCSQPSDNTTPNIRRPDKNIVSIAEADATEAIYALDSDVKLEGILLKLRAKEQYLRNHGLNATADLYIETIEHTLARQSPQLASRLGI